VTAVTEDATLERRRIRAARSQAMFREVNERIVELSKSWSAEPQFVCECESTDCAETITLTTDEYEAVRSDPGSFVVALGHNVPAVEETVYSTDRYLVVRKLGEGHDLAVEFDPRKADSDGHLRG
jgi:hypothetical protein